MRMAAAPRGESSKSDKVAGFHSAHNKPRESVVMIVGREGVGKSTLANQILDHPDSDMFKERHGRTQATTKVQRGSWGDLVVIDTPGVPSADMDPQKAVKNFDAIVEHVRAEPVLSTLVLLVNQADTVGSPDEALQDYKVLLEQFNHLPCAKLVVCRQPELRQSSARAEEESRNRSGKIITQALEDTGLSMPLILLTDGYSEESNQQTLEIVNFIRRCEAVEVDVPFFRASFELREFLADLADPKTRLRALKKEAQELEDSLWSRNLWMASHVVPLAYVSVTTQGAGFLWTGPFVKREQEEGTRLRILIKQKEIEIEKGVVNGEQLDLAQQRLDNLDALLGYRHVDGNRLALL